MENIKVAMVARIDCLNRYSSPAASHKCGKDCMMRSA